MKLPHKMCLNNIFDLCQKCQLQARAKLHGSMSQFPSVPHLCIWILSKVTSALGVYLSKVVLSNHILSIKVIIESIIDNLHASTLHCHPSDGSHSYQSYNSEDGKHSKRKPHRSMSNWHPSYICTVGERRKGHQPMESTYLALNWELCFIYRGIC